MGKRKNTVQKKKILFVYYTMMLGGSTTSLLSLLDKFDYEKYDVDLLLYKNEGPYIDYIPQQVNLLPQACVIKRKPMQALKSVIDFSYAKALFRTFKYIKRFRLTRQTASYLQLSFSRKLKKRYDVAIGFLELWSDVYVNECVKADKKISWVHVDYEKAHFIPDIDRKMFSKSDCIVHVSEECKKNFEISFPELKNKCYCVENILTKQFIQKRTSNVKSVSVELDKTFLNLLSVCRLDIDSKGLDRGVDIIKRLKEIGLFVKWYIVGDGPDREKLISQIKSSGLDNDILLLGAMECPYSIFKYFDAFFLPSRFEGKPMAVTEALMLGLPPIVAKYSSVEEQIKNEIDGIITKNDDDSIYECLVKVCENRTLLEKIRENISVSNYDNVDCIEKIYKLLD